MIGSNVFGQAQQYQQQAGDYYTGMMQNPLANADMSQYMNPYTQQVIDRSQQEIARQREKAMNTLGAQATQANAFGGSRHGIAEGETYGQYGRMAADMAAQQYQQAYNQAQQAAQTDIGYGQAGASALTGLGSQMFGQGQVGLAQQQAAAQQAQQQQQMMLDAAYNQTLANLGYPGQALQTGTGIFGQMPNNPTTTSGNPGLFGILGGASSLFGFG